MIKSAYLAKIFNFVNISVDLLIKAIFSSIGTLQVNWLSSKRTYGAQIQLMELSQLMEIKVNWLSSKLADGAQIQLIELNIISWSLMSADGNQSHLMKLKVIWWSYQSADTSYGQLMVVKFFYWFDQIGWIVSTTTAVDWIL